jgi:hypothetical protein
MEEEPHRQPEQYPALLEQVMLEERVAIHPVDLLAFFQALGGIFDEVAEGLI